MNAAPAGTGDPKTEHPMQTGIRFRTRVLLRGAVFGAACLWVCFSFWLLFGQLTGTVAIPAAFCVGPVLFAVFFVVLALHYHHLSIVVDLYGITVVGLARFETRAWSEVVATDAQTPFFPGYRANTRDGSCIVFSSMVFADARQLFDVLELYSGGCAMS